MVVIPTPESLPFKFGVNLEGGYTPPSYNPNTSDIEFRPIAEWHISNFDVDVNPVLDFPLTGPAAGVPRFQPSAAARYTLLGTVDLGLEYYADAGSIRHLEPVEREGHYLFETLELVKWAAWKLRAGLGEGLTSGSNPLTVTTIVGHFLASEEQLVRQRCPRTLGRTARDGRALAAR